MLSASIGYSQRNDREKLAKPLLISFTITLTLLTSDEGHLHTFGTPRCYGNGLENSTHCSRTSTALIETGLSLNLFLNLCNNCFSILRNTLMLHG